MTSREFMFFFMGLGFGGVVRGLAAGREVKRPAPMSAELAKFLGSVFVALAVFLAGTGLWLLYRLSFVHDRWPPVLLPMLLGIAGFSALFAWIGFRLIRDRAWNRFFASAPDGAKPKPPRHAHHLD